MSEIAILQQLADGLNRNSHYFILGQWISVGLFAQRETETFLSLPGVR
jgi:hypothetical protein